MIDSKGKTIPDAKPGSFLAILPARRKAAPRLAERGDIHTFWVQACGKALDKPLKPLIVKHFMTNDTIRAAALALRLLHGYPHFLGASLWKSAG
ncbi:hypothetical protein [Herbaspirillum huttiense]|uniref:hypothetical protein n=1 Tax=Herbaspirillum huttiense TaxID=863372 RepID=UPI0039AEFD50